jgi:ferredoxin-NADP reductase/Na+-translocating ferredoxin:NAD+ oxidoreductase RnfD subunit
MKFIDRFLNRTTMFRLLTYYLGGLLLIAFVYCALGILPYSALDLALTSGLLICVSWAANFIFARIWHVPMNAESSLITGCILALIIEPGTPDVANFFFLLWAGALAMASKYILNIRGKHVFNPAAFAVAMTALFLARSATWWIGGTLAMLPFVFAGGLLVVRKIHRADLVLAYIVSAVISSLAFTSLSVASMLQALETILIHTPLFFFAFVMITEPLTTPPRRYGRIVYGALVGFLSAPWVHIGSLYFTPELALLAGNIFSYGISPKFKAVLHLKEIRELAKDTYEFVFAGKAPSFLPGQYAEWTVHAERSDNRGNRRYFTFASSPTEKETLLGIKFYADPSSFKKLLADFSPGSQVLSGSIAGDFTLPKDPARKLAFIAGGIGITPFRSMVKYLHDTHEQRDIVMLYSNRSAQEIAYKDVFDSASRANIGFRPVYTLTHGTPPDWRGERGYIDSAMLARAIPDYKERAFYISGPQSMVDASKKTLRKMGVPRWNIRTDYFPGFA